MKVIHYIFSIDKNSGGTTTYLKELSEHLGMLCDLHIVTHHTLSPVEIKNSTIHHIRKSVFGAFQTDFAHVLEEIRPDVVHVNCTWFPQSSVALRVSKANGYKVIFTCHGQFEPWVMNNHYWIKKMPAMMLYQKYALRNADVIHATGEEEMTNLTKLGYNNNITVIPNCVNVSNIKMRSTWRKSKTILFLSRVHPKKGIEFLMDAFTQTRELADYQLIIAGNGEISYIDSLKRLATEKGISQRVQFIGPVFGEKKWSLFQTADVFVLPTYSENFGLVVTEALASGTPVITTIGTPWKELPEEGCGWYTEIGSEPTKQALIDFTKCSEQDLEVMGRKGRSLVERKYSTEHVAGMMVSLYNKTIND